MKLFHMAILLLFAARAFAFDGDEHRFIARRGFALALSVCETRPTCQLTPKQRLQITEFANAHSRLDYGTLVSSVDYRINPLQLMQKYGDQEQLPQQNSDLDPRLIQLLTSAGGAFFRAATANDTHFQGELVAGIRNWHAYAIAIASGATRTHGEADEDAAERNLFAALLVNSIADHYLHDFFAPGHVITPRFGLNDAVALSMHNKYNTLGAHFQVNRLSFERSLRPLLEHLQSGGADERFMTGASVLEGGLVPLWGDTELAQSPSQELLMILVQARSILDVLESAQGDEVNSFLRTGWHPLKVHINSKGKYRYSLPSASLPFGSYTHYLNNGRPPSSGTVLLFSIGSEILLGVNDERQREDKITTARTSYTLETLVAGRLPLDADRHATDVTRPVPVYFSEWKQYGVNVGYVYTANATEQAHGVIARGVWALPLLHSQASVDVSEKSYSFKDQQARRTAFGVKVQSGFSMVLFDLGVAREWTYGLRGSLKREVAVRFGATIVGPLSSIPYVRSMERSIYRRMRERKARN